MRYRMAALVAFTLLVTLACGDQGPESDLAPGTGVVTLTGSIARTDTVTASMLPLQILVFGTDSSFYASIVLFPISTEIPDFDSLSIRGGIPTFGGGYSVLVDIRRTRSPKTGMSPIDEDTRVTVLDSLGMASFVNSFPFDTTRARQPSAILEATTGQLTLDRIDQTGYAGSLSITAKDETGRIVNLAGRFNATTLALPPGLGRFATSPLPPFSRARR